MKIAIPQYMYPANYGETLEVMNAFLATPGKCEKDTDLLVLPEFSNCPGIPLSEKERMFSHAREHNESFLDSLRKSAVEYDINICTNMLYERKDGFSNTTFIIDKSGEITAEYDKTHLAFTELEHMGLIPGSELVFAEIDGVTVTFAICFELYFPEFFESLALGKPDIILAPSYQRSENSEILLKQAMGRALDTGAFLIRSSYSMGTGSKNGGMSYAVNPSGEVLLNAGQDTGLFTIEINPKENRMRPLAHGLGNMPSREIVEKFRIPGLYRNNEVSEQRDYPRVCAHRGHSGRVPENTLPSFASALALGADEIEFDVRLTKDNKMIVCHDNTVDRVSDGSGNVSDLTFDEIRSLNAGEYMGWKDVKFPTPEEIFNQLANRIVFNIHVYQSGEDGSVISRLKKLIDQHDAVDSVYFAAQEREMEWCLKLAPSIDRCMLECFDEDRDIVDIALEYNCCKVQHFYSVYSSEIVRKASKNGLKNNLFYEDDPKKIKSRLSDGIDTILSNYADVIIPVVKAL